MTATVPLLDLQAQYGPLRDEILAAITRVCDSQRFIMGPEIDALESELARMLGVAHAVAVSSGTDARAAGADGARHRARRRGGHVDLFVLRDRRRDRPRRRAAGARRHRSRRRSTSTRRQSRAPSRRGPRRSCRCICSA